MVFSYFLIKFEHKIVSEPLFQTKQKKECKLNAWGNGSELVHFLQSLRNMEFDLCNAFSLWIYSFTLTKAIATSLTNGFTEVSIAYSVRNVANL